MEIKLDKKHRIRTRDEDNIIVEEKYKAKDGTMKWKTISYHARLRDALLSCIDSPRFTLDIKTLDEFKTHINKIRKLKKDFEKLFEL